MLHIIYISIIILFFSFYHYIIYTYFIFPTKTQIKKYKKFALLRDIQLLKFVSTEFKYDSQSFDVFVEMSFYNNYLSFGEKQYLFQLIDRKWTKKYILKYVESLIKQKKEEYESL